MIVVTCEHACPAIPRRYESLFRGRSALLTSHRGYDIGALPLARRIAKRFDARLLSGRVSRLLVDLNRSPSHPGLHDATVRALPDDERATIVSRYYVPLREATSRLVAAALERRETALHLSVHSFTPRLDGKLRRADFGILYDPRRGGELALADELRRELCARLPHFGVRKNHPYRGTADGHTTALRRRFRGRGYLGLELELNQRWATGASFRDVASAVVASLACCPTLIAAAAQPGSR